MKPKLNSVFVDHILQAFADVTGFVSGQASETFGSDKLVSYATVRALHIVGEASKGIDPEVRDRFPEIPWRSMTGMRDRLVHDYFDTEWAIVWNVATVEIPALNSPMLRIRDQQLEEAQLQPETNG